MALRFKTEAEYDRWQKSLPERPRLRVAASSGERVLVTPTEAVASAPRRRTVRDRLPGRDAVRRAAGWGFLGVTWAGLWGASLCLAVLWVLGRCG